MVNRMRATRAHRDNRRSHHALDAMRLSKDVKTGSIHQRHRVDMATGMYRGRKILDITSGAVSAVSASPEVTSTLENAPARIATATKSAPKVKAAKIPETHRPVKSDGDSNKK